MSCINCGGSRVASISAKCSDLCAVQIGDKSKEGYVPSDMGIGGGDYVEFDWCLDCLRIQSDRLPLTELEAS
jgi:hypothetical protein